MEKRYTLRQMIIITISAVIVSACLAVGATWLYYLFSTRYEISFDPGSVQYDNVVKFDQVRSILKNDYYQGVDENILLEGAVKGLADALGDPYTVYFNKQQMQAFMEKSEGSYVGIGVTVNMGDDGYLTIVEPFVDSPAWHAGIKKGDKIVKVDETDVGSIRDENMIISMIKGTENTKVNITIYRPDDREYLQFDIVRKRIKTSNIKSEILDGGIGYIKLIMFDSEIAGYFKNDLNKMLREKINGLIIDLRDNPGGSYEQVVEIADMLLPQCMIVYTEDRNGARETQHSGKSYFDIPLVILINGNSASASEILAGAVKDNERGVLVGTKTFGKGLVQNLVTLHDGSGIKFTVSRYFTPSGISIHGVGIAPAVEIDTLSEYKNFPISQIPRDKDIQLHFAVEVLEGRVDY